MNRLIAVFAGVSLAVSSTQPLSADFASAPDTNSREQSGGSLMRQPLMILAQVHQSIPRSQSFGRGSRPNVSKHSSGPASRIHGTAARGSSRAVSRGRAIGQRGPSSLPSANQVTPGSPGSPGSFVPGTGQSDSVGILNPNARNTGAGVNGPRVPGDGNRLPGGGLSAGQDVIEFLNAQNLRGLPNLQLEPPQAPGIARQQCKINCIDANMFGGVEPLAIQCGKKSNTYGWTPQVLFCELACGGKVVQAGSGTPFLGKWLICINKDNCPKIEAKFQEVGPLGRPSFCSWYSRYNSNDRRMFDKIRCPQGTTWHDRDKDDPNKLAEQVYATLQEAGVELPLLADFELGSCWPDNL